MALRLPAGGGSYLCFFSERVDALASAAGEGVIHRGRASFLFLFLFKERNSYFAFNSLGCVFLKSAFAFKWG